MRRRHFFFNVFACADPKRVASSARASAVSAASSAGGWTLQRWTSPTTKTWRTGERVSKRAGNAPSASALLHRGNWLGFPKPDL